MSCVKNSVIPSAESNSGQKSSSLGEGTDIQNVLPDRPVGSRLSMVLMDLIVRLMGGSLGVYFGNDFVINIALGEKDNNSNIASKKNGYPVFWIAT